MRQSAQGRSFTTNTRSGAFDSTRFLKQLDIVTSEQYLSQGYVIAQAEKRLMLAVLLDAVECFTKFAPVRSNRPDRTFKEAQEWIFQDDPKWPFSFVNICDAVGMNAQCLRKGLSQWTKKRSHSPILAGYRSAAEGLGLNILPQRMPSGSEREKLAVSRMPTRSEKSRRRLSRHS